MKKLILFLLLAPLFAASQDSTNVNIVDSSKMYRYTGTYTTIQQVHITPPGIFGAVPSTTDTTNWQVNLTVAVYASKADFRNGKQPLFIKYSETLFVPTYPSKRDILDLMRKVVK